MGCFSSKPSPPPSIADSKTKEIDAQLKQSFKEEQKRTKILLLGAGESGKTTILRQVRLMTNEPFSQQEREDFREVLWANATQAMQAILNAVIEMELQVMDPECQRAALYLVKTQLPQPLVAYRTSIADAVQKLWRDPVIQIAFGRSREYQLVDSASYLFDRVPEMAKVDWLPTDQDMLRVRIKTTGIQEILFTMEKHEFRLFDVGGQKSERRKWIQCFEDVQVCLFVAALSEFDLQMYEDSETNRWQDTEILYEATVNSRWLTNSTLVLFLNKCDLFRAKVNTTKLSTYFPAYPPENDHSFTKGSHYLHSRLTNLHRDKTRRCYVHYTTATDTEQMKTVIHSVADSVLRQNLAVTGIL